MKGYFDYNATSPLSEKAKEAWLAASERFWHNPSSLYREAGAARRQLEDAREWLADRVGAEPERVVFTGGASEANHAILRYVASRSSDDRSATLAISAIEHPSVREPAISEFGRARVIEIPTAQGGDVDPETAGEILGASSAPVLVSVMAANNETGVLQPWRQISELCRERGVPFHCDAAQWIGKLPISGMGERCDFLTGCAHKFGGPKGTGFLLIPEDEVEKFRSILGGPQESGHRAGTEDLPGVLAMIAALDEKSDSDLEALGEEKQKERCAFESRLEQAIPGAAVIAGQSERLWNTSLFVVPAHSNLKWLTRLSNRGFSVSTGSACSAGRGNPSRVMEAMGIAYEEMGRVIRASGGWETSGADWDSLLEALISVSADLDEGRRQGSKGMAGGLDRG